MNLNKEIDLIINELKTCFNSELKGKLSQLKMAPPHRISSLEIEINPPKKAMNSAVLLLIRPEKTLMESSILLIKRSSYNGVHSNQIALPGGKFDEKDIDFENTAIREVEEEVGINKTEYKIIGKLTHIYIPPSNFTIHPYVGILTEEANIFTNKREISGYRFIKISDFIQKEKIQNKEFKITQTECIQAPCYSIDDYHIWGGTAMIISEFIDQTSISL